MTVRTTLTGVVQLDDAHLLMTEVDVQGAIVICRVPQGDGLSNEGLADTQLTPLVLHRAIHSARCTAALSSIHAAAENIKSQHKPATNRTATINLMYPHLQFEDRQVT